MPHGHLQNLEFPCRIVLRLPAASDEDHDHYYACEDAVNDVDVDDDDDDADTTTMAMITPTRTQHHCQSQHARDRGLQHQRTS